jgi:hypothetical protein
MWFVTMTAINSGSSLLIAVASEGRQRQPIVDGANAGVCRTVTFKADAG